MSTCCSPFRYLCSERVLKEQSDSCLYEKNKNKNMKKEKKKTKKISTDTENMKDESQNVKQEL